MSDQDKRRWNERYAAGAYGTRRHPSELVAEWAPRILASLQADSRAPPRALDLACGAGRNACYLAALGFQVDALDISDAGLASARAMAEQEGLQVCWFQHDLDESLPPRFRGYDLILLVRYVNLPLLRTLPGRLAPGGWLICEEHLQSDADVVGPANPAFRVAPAALAEAVPGMDVAVATEGIVSDPDGRPAALARLVARRPLGCSGSPG